MNTSQIVDALTRLRVAAGLEGISYLVLLGIAMPLKYMAGRPEAVQVVGWIHGGLFVLFLLALGDAWRRTRWPYERVAAAVAAGVIPFGTFVLDRRLRRDIQATRQG